MKVKQADEDLACKWNCEAQDAIDAPTVEMLILHVKDRLMDVK